MAIWGWDHTNINYAVYCRRSKFSQFLSHSSISIEKGVAKGQTTGITYPHIEANSACKLQAPTTVHSLPPFLFGQLVLLKTC